MIRLILTLLILIVCRTTSLSAEEKVLIFVYEEQGRAPYIQTKPDNSGIYYELMKRIVEKNRIHAQSEKNAQKTSQKKPPKRQG